MRALCYTPGAPQGLALDEVPDPDPGPGRALVRVAAVSLNFAHVAYPERQQAGTVPGFDAAGVVVAGAADGAGPSAGTPVATFDWSAGWAELRAVEPGELAPVPAGLDLGTAAAVPVAGVTALRALRRLGPLLGRRVLVTGASGGVGGFAVQLAALAGAQVIAAVGHPDRGAGLGRLGAAEVVTDLADVDAPVAGAVDNVGGDTLARVYDLLEPGGCVQSVGGASRQPTRFDFEAARRRGGRTRVEAFAVGPGFGPDLAWLLDLVVAGRLDPQIGWRGPWEQAPDAAAALLARTVRGKAVLDVTAP